MSNQFKVQGLESNNQVTPSTRITILINKDVHSNFTNTYDLNFEIDGNKVDWPLTSQGIPSDIYSFTPQEIGLRVRPVAYNFSLDYIDNSSELINGDTLGSISVRVVGIISPDDDPNTYITAPFVSRINAIDLQGGTLDLEQSWGEFANQVRLNERQIPEIAETKIQGLKKFYGVSSKEGLEFFEAHKSADVIHRAECEKLLDNLTEEEQKKAEESSLLTARYLWNFLSGMTSKHKLNLIAA